MNELIDPELDALPKLIIETRDDEVVASIVGKRVRGKEPQGPVLDRAGNQIDAGDVRATGQYVPFVVIVRQGGPGTPRLPIRRSRYLFRCYGINDRQAAVLANACIRALDGKGPRTFSNGLGIYSSTVASEPEQDRDPDTQQPMESFVLEVVATTQGVV